MKCVSTYGGEFEVTEADMAAAAPLGQEACPEDQQRSQLIDSLKHFVKWQLEECAFPKGHWDAFLDEGDWVHDDVAYPDCRGGVCFEGSHHVARPANPENDSVFVRLQTEAVKDPIWDIEVLTRPRMTSEGVDTHALPTINSEEYSPEDCVRDLGVLLSVFRLYVNQGKI